MNIKRDVRFGKLAVNAGLITDAQLEQSLGELIEERTQGASISLGQLLVQQGVLTREQVRDIIRSQKKELLICEGCDTRFNVLNYDPEKSYRCRKCGEALAHHDDEEESEYQRTVGDSAADVPAFKDTAKLAEDNRAFGEIAVSKKYIRSETFKVALTESNRLEIRIGEFLVSKGLLHTGQVMEILEDQHKRILHCRECGHQYNVKKYEEGKSYQCKDCGGELIEPQEVTLDVVAELQDEFPSDMADLPDPHADTVELTAEMQQSLRKMNFKKPVISSPLELTEESGSHPSVEDEEPEEEKPKVREMKVSPKRVVETSLPNDPGMRALIEDMRKGLTPDKLAGE